jgi:putative membrane protein
MSALITLVINAAALAVTIWLFDGITLTGNTDTDKALTLVLVAAIFGIVNAIVRPVVAILSLPLYILTLGLIAFVINALMLMLTSWISGEIGIGFNVEGFWTALLGAIVISIVGALLGAVLRKMD